jgi:hypothetical protein
VAVLDARAGTLRRGRGFAASLAALREGLMITCYLRYVIDPHKLAEFETYARMWIPLVEKFGGKHHGYFLPHEGASDVALALFSFPSLAAYEGYRAQAASDPDCRTAMAYYEETRCFLSFERSFMRPVFGPESA